MSLGVLNEVAFNFKKNFQDQMYHVVYLVKIESLQFPRFVAAEPSLKTTAKTTQREAFRDTTSAAKNNDTFFSETYTSSRGYCERFSIP